MIEEDRKKFRMFEYRLPLMTPSQEEKERQIKIKEESKNECNAKSAEDT